MRIFVSSTFKDLRPERQAALDALRRAEVVPWGMELFVSESSTPLDVALRELRLSDAVVLIIGFRAGSLCPESPNLTYTAAEFRLAQELGKPLWVFIQTEGGAWQNKETTEALKIALEDFKRAVLNANLTPAYFDNPDRLQVELLLTLKRWESDGRPGARLTFTTVEEFFAPYRSAAPRLLDFSQTLHGRTGEIEALNTFWASSELVIGILTGRGGIGKSKLLHDWAGGLGNAKALYVREDAVWHPEAAKEIPSGNLVIIGDDAHRFDFLDNLVIVVRNLKQRQNIKLVLSVRPSGSSQIDAALAARFEPGQIRRFAQLERVRHQSVIALAQESLGPNHLQYAPALAAVSADTPLVTVVGGRLIARGDIAPALLANEEDFRRQVFDRFAAEYERLLPAGNVDWRQLLNLIAAVGPLTPNAENFRKPAAEILRLRPDEILQAIDRLERHGLLLRGGRLVRIVPDLLSDFLLEGACLTRAGDSTGFADYVFRSFQPAYLSNIIRNLGELDWRITQRNEARGTRLLDQIWVEINSSFEAADAEGRVKLLESLKEAALFQPSRVMGLIRRAMETKAAPVEVLPDWSITQENVLDKIPPLLRPIALHLEHFDEAVNILWSLAQRDSRASNQYAEHARRVLEDLARYERYKPAIFNDRMADVATRLSRQEGAFNGDFTPLSIADKLLAKEGEFTEAEEFTISFGGFALNYEAIRPVREKAIAIIESCLNSEDAKVALRAVSSIAHILSGFLPAVVRQASPEEYAWQNAERETALRIIQARFGRATPVPIARQIRYMLRQARPSTNENPVRQRIDTVLSSIPVADDLIVFDAFCTAEWELDAQFATLEEASRAQRELAIRGVEIFRRKYTAVRRQVEALVQLVVDAESWGIDLRDKPYSFIDGLCTDCEFLDELVAYLLNNPHPYLAQMICIALRRLRHTDLARYRDVGLQAAAHENPYIGFGTANAVCYGPSLTAPVQADLAILEVLSQHSNVNVRYLAFTGIRRIGAHAEYERAAVNLLLRSDVGDDSKMAEEMCGTVDHAGIDLAHLSEAEIRNLLQKLVATNDIDGYHIGRFLDRVGQNHPAMICEFTINRLDRYAGMQNRGETTTGYTPVRRERFGNAFHALQGSAQYDGFLIQVRDRFTSQSEQRYWLRELFWAIAAVDTPTLAALDELFHSDDKEQVRAAVDLVGGAPPELALSRPWFALHMIEQCECLDHDLAERAASVLIANAHVGPFQRTPGQPSPRYLTMKEHSAALRKIFAPDSIGQRFFSRLYDSAVSALERERVDDEEQGFD
jgi:hypothetical protein